MAMGKYLLFSLFSFVVVVQAATTDANCQLALGLESGAILNSQLSSSTKVSVLQGPTYARLHRRDGGGGWTAGTSNTGQYLTVDLLKSTRISGVATQGRYTTEEYVREYKLQYSDDGKSWTTYKENGKEKVFQGNSNAEKVHRNDMSSPFTARYVRINPRKWNEAPSMRLELYGCLADEGDTATFDGSSYIKYDITKDNIKTAEELIQFMMRTEKPDGIILASSGTQTDYITLQLKEGKVVLSIDLGTTNGKSGATILEAGSLLDDNQWHFIQYKRRDKAISLTVDGVTVSGTTNGYFKRLDLDMEMTVGGASSPLMPGLQVEDNFVGCLQSVALSNSISAQSLPTALYFIKAAKEGSQSQISIQGSLTYECTGGAQVAATFPTQDSYLKWPGPSPGTNFTAKFKFRTFNKDGLIIYNKGSGDGYIAVGLKDGTVSIAIKVPSQPIVEIPGERMKPLSLQVIPPQETATSSPPPPPPEGSGLADGRWHEVRAEVANDFVKVMVNGNTEPTQKNLNIRTTADYFIGGSTAPEEETANMPGFRGCLRDVYLGDIMVDFLSIQEDETNEAVINEGVDVDTCGLHDWCTPNPCEHGGQCFTDWETFICSCRGTGYAGATCHSTDKPRACEREGTMKIDVDGSGPLAPFDVQCEQGDDDILYTIVSHDAESSEPVPDGNGDPGSYMRDIVYGDNEEITSGQLKSLTEAAEYCEQYIKYQCSGAKLFNSPNGPQDGWWVSVHNDKMNYWGGAAPNTGKCMCGMDLSCVDNNKYCNCDADNTQNQVDEGLLMDKESLPVIQLRFGDRADGSSSSSYELGKLRCRGDAYADKVVTFQSDKAHLRFPVTTTKENALDLSVDFKTLTTGVVLLSADGADGSFIQLELEDSTIVLFQVDFGAGVKTVRASVTDDLNDDEWHRVQAVLNIQEISLKVDSELPERTALDSGNLHLQLTSDLFVGSSTLQSDGYVGCMRSLFINGEFVDLTSKTAEGVAMGCVGKCTEETCFNGGVCQEFYDKFVCQCAGTAFEGEFCSEEIGAKLDSGSEISYSLKTSDIKDYSEDAIILGFSTTTKQGVLLRVDDGSGSGEYEEVSILPNGNLQYSFKLGASSDDVPIIVSDKDLADGRHHLVEIRRTGKDLRLKVGDYPTVFTSVDIADTTLQGANRVVIGSTDTSKSFIGCISRVQFNEIATLKLFWGNRPATMRGTGTVGKSRCGVEPQMPPAEVMPTTEMMLTTDGGPTKVALTPQRGYRPGDKAAIAIVILLLLIALVILIAFIGRYKYKHKGVYKTNEARGADNARDADTAVMMADTKQPKFEKKKEWYI